MSFFKQVEGEAAILVNNGIYTQVDLYERDGYLFAKHGGGFVRLMADGSTSRAKLRLDFMSWEGPLCRDATGKLCRATATQARPLESDRARQFLGAPK